MVDWHWDKDWSKQHGTGETLDDRDGKPLPRIGGPPPCKDCPKMGPEHESEVVLSEKNWQTYRFAQAVKATCGACLSERARTDPILLQNLAVVEEVTRQYEQYQLTQAVLLAAPRS
jgi:hypothetical protein